VHHSLGFRLRATDIDFLDAFPIPQIIVGADKVENRAVQTCYKL
jgi:hypothetical protein